MKIFEEINLRFQCSDTFADVISKVIVISTTLQFVIATLSNAKLGQLRRAAA